MFCRLEQECGYYFNMRYFEEKVRAGEWDEVDKYLSGFTTVDENNYSMKLFFEIRKHKYLEALNRYIEFIFVFILRYILFLFTNEFDLWLNVLLYLELLGKTKPRPLTY